MLKQIAHICIMSHDLEATERFYCDLLGLQRSFDFLKDGELYGYYLGLGARTFIEVFHNATATAGENPSMNHMCLEVENLDEVIAHVRAAGHEITDKRKGADNTWQAWLNDPSDIRIELFEYTETSAQFTGADCFVDW